MKPGILKIFFLVIIFFKSQSILFADDKIKSVPLVNLEDLSPTFEEEKDELEKIEEKKLILEKNKKIVEDIDTNISGKVFVNIKALDKITAKTFDIRLVLGEEKIFGPLEIKVLKCQLSKDEYISNTTAYLQVKDNSIKNNNQVFLFNGWTFTSSPTLKSIEHPVYDLWITSCENI